jgi:hypothetical protein
MALQRRFVVAGVVGACHGGCGRSSVTCGRHGWWWWFEKKELCLLMMYIHVMFPANAAHVAQYKDRRVCTA